MTQGIWRQVALTQLRKTFMRPIGHLPQRENDNFCVCTFDHIPMLKFAIEVLKIIIILQ